METKTAGQEFEDFVKFAMTNKEPTNKKRRNVLTHQEVRDLVKKHNITEDVFRKFLEKNGSSTKVIERAIQRTFHPTEKDFEFENSEAYKNHIKSYEY